MESGPALGRARLSVSHARTHTNTLRCMYTRGQAGAGRRAGGARVDAGGVRPARAAGVTCLLLLLHAPRCPHADRLRPCVVDANAHGNMCECGVSCACAVGWPDCPSSRSLCRLASLSLCMCSAPDTPQTCACHALHGRAHAAARARCLQCDIAITRSSAGMARGGGESLVELIERVWLGKSCIAAPCGNCLASLSTYLSRGARSVASMHGRRHAHAGRRLKEQLQVLNQQQHASLMVTRAPHTAIHSHGPVARPTAPCPGHAAAEHLAGRCSLGRAPCAPPHSWACSLMRVRAAPSVCSTELT